MTQPTLLILHGEDQGTRFELDRSQYRIGRGLGCDIRLPDHEVSRLHATLMKKGDEFWVRDEQSSNGTQVNGEDVEEHRVLDGDTLVLGRTTLLFSQRALSDKSVEDRVSFFQDAPESDRSNIISHASLEESNSLLSASALEQQPALGQTLSSLRTLYRITEETVSSSHSLEQILQRVLEEVLEAVGAERGCILLKDPTTGAMKPEAVVARSENVPGRIPVSRSIVDHVWSTERGVRTTDAKEDTRFKTGQSILREGIREALCSPMQGKFELVGVIYVDTTARDFEEGAEPEHHFTEEQLHLMMAVGRQTALAVESHRYQNALIQAERLAAMGQTVAAISHHIKNILQGIRGGVYLVDSGLNDEKPDVIRHGWEIIDRNQERIHELVQDMLTFSKERDPEVVEANLKEVVEDVLQIISHRAEENGVKIQFEAPEEMPASQFDSESIHRVILNIVTNALDALEEVEEGKIMVTCGYDERGDRIFVAIADNGPGIPEDQREKIFQAFHSSKAKRGTGLGLAVSRKIVREHGGELLLETEVGKGTRFTLAIPRLGPEEARIGPGSSVIKHHEEA